MHTPILFILLQGPPPPDDWGDPDIPATPVNQYVWLLLLAAVLLGILMIYVNSRKPEDK